MNFVFCLYMEIKIFYMVHTLVLTNSPKLYPVLVAHEILH